MANSRGSNRDAIAGSQSRATDEIVAELKKTKQLFRKLIFAHLIAMPTGFIMVLLIYGSPFSMYVLLDARPPPNHPFTFPYVIPILALLGWLLFAIRRWIVLSRLTSNY